MIANDPLANLDLWRHIMSFLLQDDVGNITIPGLAMVSVHLRPLSRDFRTLANSLVTPYDGHVTYTTETRMIPERVSGGMVFGTCHALFERQHYSLIYVRCTITSQVFAVTVLNHSTHIWYRDHLTKKLRLDWMYKVEDSYGVPQLARLLSGHSNNRNHRLEDIERVAFQRNGIAVAKKDLYRYVEHDDMLVTRGVARLTRHKHIDVSVPREEHTRDFISHRVSSTAFHPYCKLPDLVLSIVHGDMRIDKCKLGCRYAIADRKRFEFNIPEDSTADWVHYLSIANGFYAPPLVAEGPKWMTSIFDHEMQDYPRKNCEILPAKLDAMIAHSILRHDRNERARAKARAKAFAKLPRDAKRRCRATPNMRCAAVRAVAKLQTEPHDVLDREGRVAQRYQSQKDIEEESRSGDWDDSFQGAVPGTAGDRSDTEDEEYMPDEDNLGFCDNEPAPREPRERRERRKERKERRKERKERRKEHNQRKERHTSTEGHKTPADKLAEWCL